jgi:hypothetical protein
VTRQHGEGSNGRGGAPHEFTAWNFHLDFSPRAGGGAVIPKPGPRCCQRKLSTAVIVSFSLSATIRVAFIFERDELGLAPGFFQRFFIALDWAMGTTKSALPWMSRIGILMVAHVPVAKLG